MERAVEHLMAELACGEDLDMVIAEFFQVLDRTPPPPLDLISMKVIPYRTIQMGFARLHPDYEDGDQPLDLSYPNLVAANVFLKYPEKSAYVWLVSILKKMRTLKGCGHDFNSHKRLHNPAGGSLSPRAIAKIIGHTLLRDTHALGQVLRDEAHQIYPYVRENSSEGDGIERIELGSRIKITKTHYISSAPDIVVFFSCQISLRAHFDLERPFRKI